MKFSLQFSALLAVLAGVSAAPYTYETQFLANSDVTYIITDGHHNPLKVLDGSEVTVTVCDTIIPSGTITPNYCGGHCSTKSGSAQCWQPEHAIACFKSSDNVGLCTGKECAGDCTMERSRKCEGGTLDKGFCKPSGPKKLSVAFIASD